MIYGDVFFQYFLFRNQEVVWLLTIEYHFTMLKLTSEQRLQIVEMYYENQRCVKKLFHALRATTVKTIELRMHYCKHREIISNPLDITG